MNAISAGKTVAGRRKSNQDRYCIESRWGLYVVADGMGGYEGGEVASATAVESIREFFRANAEDDGVTWPYGVRRELSFAENMVRVAVRSANQAVMVRRRGALANMGSTVVVLSLQGDRAVVAHMGDSRIYRVRGGSVEQLTRDHSMYNELCDAGASDLGPERDFGYRNIVTRALGFTTSAGDEPTLGEVEAREGDVFLLCTDGLYETIEDDMIIGAVRASETLDGACETLVDLAYERGSSDNITAVLVRVERVEERPGEGW